MQQKYAVVGIEPPLEELLNDRTAQLLMQRDGVGLADVLRAVEAARSRVAARAQGAAEPPRSLSNTAKSSPELGTDQHAALPSG